MIQYVITVAIDPGKLGAIAYFVNGVFKGATSIPLIGKDTIDKIALYALINPKNVAEYCLNTEQMTTQKWTIQYAMESVRVNWMGGKKQVAEARGNIMLIIGMLTAIGFPYHEILPANWQKYCWQGVTLVKKADGKTDTKTTSFMALQRLIPDAVEGVRIKKKPYFHDGLVDAILIGYYVVKNL